MKKNMPLSIRTRTILLASLIATGSLAGCGKTNLSDIEHIERAKDFQDKGDLTASVIELKSALQQSPDNLEARWLLGEIYVKKGFGAEAEKELIRARELGVEGESIKIPMGRALLMQGKFKRVLEEISPSASTSQRNKAAILQMHGDAKLGLNQMEEGCQLYKDSLGVDPKHVPAYWGLANCALAKRNLSETRAMIDTAIKIDGADPESWVVLGEFERLNNKHQAAAQAYSTALKHDPNNLNALFGRAQIYAYTGKPTEARADLENLKKLAPGYFGIHFVEAVLNYSAGKTDQALDSVQRALKSHPDYLPGKLLFALVQYDRKAYEEAAIALTGYLERAPGHLDVRKLLAAAYLKLGQPDRSLELLKPYIAAGKADAQVLALAGEAHLRSDDPSSAKVFFEKAADLVPTSTALRTQVGLSHLVAGEEAQAIKELEASSAMAGKDYRADVALAYYFLSEGQFDKALAAIAVLEKKLPDSPGTYSLKGQAYLGKKDFAQARKNFERAMALEPTLVSAAVRLAAIDLQEKNFSAARGRYQAILDKDSKNVPAMVGLAELAALEKKESEYLAWLERAAKASPAALVPRAFLANYYLGKNQLQKALTLAREAVTSNPGSTDALELLGRMQLAAGEKENAVATYTKLAAIAPKSPTAQYDLAKAHAAMADEKAMRGALLKALELKPDYSDALAALSALERRTGKQTEAIRLARKLQASVADSPRGFALEGDALMVEKRYTEATSAYEKALAKGKDSELVVKQHLALLRSGNASKADDMLLGWLRAHPQDQIAMAYLAESYTRRGLRQEAIRQYETVLSSVPNNAVVLNNLAVLYQQQQDPRALPMAEKAYKLDPDSPAYADTLGWILIQQGQSGRGLQLLEKAVADAPKNQEIRFHFAYALVHAGQTSQARQEIGRLQNMKLSPELEQQVGQLLQRLH